MTTAPPTTKSPILPATQLKLPIANPETNSPISSQEVWAKLDQRQKEALFRQMVMICCELVKKIEAEEASDE